MKIKEFNNINEIKNIDIKIQMSDKMKDKNIIVLYDDFEDIITIAFYHKPTLKELKCYIEEYGKSFKIYCIEEKISDYDYWEKHILNKCDGKIYLDYIESFKRYQGGAKAIINYMKNKFNNIWLYSLCETEEFYNHIGFENLGEYIYFY